MPKELKGAEVEEVIDILSHYFTRDEFEKLLYTSLSRNLDDYTERGVWTTELFQLIKAANKRGFVIDLLKAVAAEETLPPVPRARLAELASIVASRPDGVTTGILSPSPDPAIDESPAPAVSKLEPAGSFASTLANWLRNSSNRILITGLAAYAILLTSIGSVSVPVRLVVESTPEQRDRAVAAGAVSAHETLPQFVIPRPGFAIFYGEYSYGVNGDGYARISFPPLRYLKTAAVDRQIPLEIQYPGGGRTQYTPAFTWSGIAQIQLNKTNDDPGPGDTMGFLWDEGGSKVARTGGGWSFIGTAHAALPTTGRLYVQSVSPGKGANASAVDAMLHLGNADIPLNSLSVDLTSAQPSQLPVVPGAVTVQSYQSFFPLPQPSLNGKTSIALQASGSLFSYGGYSETFVLPPSVPLGKPVEVTGDAGGKLVVQLAYPVDVVFFERQGTSPGTDQLVPLVGEAGFAIRRNSKSATLPGSYNVVYAGKDVSTAALQAVIKVLFDNNVDIRSIQPGLQLRNGLQNQIQIGSSAQVACLPALSAQQRAKLLGSEVDFNSVTGSLSARCP